MQMHADQPENNRQLEFIIKQLHSGAAAVLLSRYFFHSSTSLRLNHLIQVE